MIERGVHGNTLLMVEGDVLGKTLLVDKGVADGERRCSPEGELTLSLVGF